MRINTWLVLAGAVATATVGCDKDDKGGAGASASASSSATPKASGAAHGSASGAVASAAPAGSAGAGGVGLDAPGNDPAVVAAAKKAVTCKWNDEGYVEEYNCDAAKDWQKINLKTENASTFVSMLEDPSPAARVLAVDKAYRSAETFKEDKGLAGRLVAVGEKLPADTKGAFPAKLGRVIGFLDLTKTGVFDRVKALASKADAPEGLRQSIANWELAGNQENEQAYTLTKDLATGGATPAIKASALIALSAAYVKHPTEEMCKLWSDALPTLDDHAGALIASHLTNADLQVANLNVNAFPYNWAMINSDDNKCSPAQADAALVEVEKRFTAGTAKDGWWTTALHGPQKSKNATPAQKAKAIAIARGIADKKTNAAYLRTQGLDVLVDIDPASAKTVAAGFAKETDATLKSGAERATKRIAENEKRDKDKAAAAAAAGKK